MTKSYALAIAINAWASGYNLSVLAAGSSVWPATIGFLCGVNTLLVVALIIMTDACTERA